MSGEGARQDELRQDEQRIGSRVDETNPANVWHEGEHVLGNDATTSNALDSKRSKLSRAKRAVHTLFKRVLPAAEPLNEAQDVVTDAPVNSCRLLDMPMDILVIVFEHLDPTDCEMVRYTCRAFYHGIPAFNFAQMHGRCIRSRILRRLYDSSLLPYVRQRNRYLTKTEIKEKFEMHNNCIFCSFVWLSGSRVYCPFHKPLGEYVVPPLFPLNDRHNLLRWEYVRWALRARRTLTREGYGRLVVNGADHFVLPPHHGHFITWNEEIARIEDEHLVDLANQEAEGQEARGRIITLYCCSHCYSVLPGNDSSRLCNKCDCTFCGWTDVDLVRNEDRGGHVRYIPLGKIHELPEKKSRKARKLKAEDDKTR